jgi:hypothetical protein
MPDARSSARSRTNTSPTAGTEHGCSGTDTEENKPMKWIGFCSRKPWFWSTSKPIKTIRLVLLNATAPAT